MSVPVGGLHWWPPHVISRRWVCLDRGERDRWVCPYLVADPIMHVMYRPSPWTNSPYENNTLQQLPLWEIKMANIKKFAFARCKWALTEFPVTIVDKINHYLWRFIFNSLDQWIPLYQCHLYWYFLPYSCTWNRTRPNNYTTICGHVKQNKKKM